jgi:radical SAM protein with 4Fe4S-binding SPASM domain
MNDFQTIVNRLKEKRSSQNLAPPTAGLYHFERHWEDCERSRVHLRIEPDGNGLLLVNASRVIHLNPTATYMAYLSLHQVSENNAQKALVRHFRVPKAQAKIDYIQCSQQIEELIRPDGACPIHELDIEITAPFSTRPSAPYRMDLAITYHCNNDCTHCYNARQRDYPEMNTSQWIEILDKLWAIGVPHVVFTGGEPTLREDLPELITHAEKNGQITGINTNGRRLSDEGYLDKLVQAGLDHVQITLESHDPDIHDQMVLRKGAWKQTVSGIRNALETRLFVMTNTTMLSTNSQFMSYTLDFLASLGVPTIGLNALIYSGKGLNVGNGLPEKSMIQLLELAREKTNTTGQRLIWYTPTQYCNFDPMQLELGVKGCTAALYNMCIEPNGDVIPCQSYYVSLGNMHINSWTEIWNHDLAIHLRERRYIPSKCESCALLTECGGGCPLRLHIDDQALQSMES